MNVIFIVCDTVVKNKLSPYHQGNGPYGYIQTPNLERLAKRSVRFDNHWLGSTPCMPARRDFWSGRIEFPWRSWGPRESFDPDWCKPLRQSDVFTAFFTDHANIMDVGAGNYHHLFDYYSYTRGHFNDHCEPYVPVKPGRAREAHDIYQEHNKNLPQEPEEAAFCAQNLGNVAQWLDEHHNDASPFFVCVDEFDPHWPLDPTEPYRSMYLEDPLLIEKNISTSYHSNWAKDYTEEQITWLNAQCAGKITEVDHWIGEVLDRMDRYNLWENTLLIVTTDHGEFVGEYGQMSKGAGFSYPIFANIPLFIAMPNSPLAGQSVDALTWSVDINATVLDFFEQQVGESSHGRSLLPILREGENQGHDSILYGWWGKGFYWTDGHCLLCKAAESEGPLFQYGTNLGEKWVGLRGDYFDRYQPFEQPPETGQYFPHIDRPVYKVPYDGMAYSSPEGEFDAVFDLLQDPDCEHNLYASKPDLRDRLLEKLIKKMQELQVPEEHYLRLGLKKN